MMKYIDEFRNKTLVKKTSCEIKTIIPRRLINIMEVCGTHTQNFFRFGLNNLLPENLKLIAGPGCPVCVSSQSYIDNAIKLSKNKNLIILSFGDMLRVKGTKSSLENEQSCNGNIHVVYSSLDALKVAKENPKKKVVFLAVGFETTAPTIALTLLKAEKEKVKNLFFYTSLKLIPPAMIHLLRDKRLKLDAFLCPGHVSAIIGSKTYLPIVKKYKVNCCVAGFEPLDILEGIYLLIKQLIKNKPLVSNQYLRVVTKYGNLKAQRVLRRVFRQDDGLWRGLGKIPASGLTIRREFSGFDALKVFAIRPEKEENLKTKGCRCAEVLKGLVSPLECPLFYKSCRPDNPIGPCMVSSEGACNAYYKYKK